MPGEHVFLSYCRDNLEEVRQLRDDLLKAGIEVVWDQDFVSGPEWRLQIRESMETSCAIVLCFSDEVLARNESHMFSEVYDAIEFYRRRPPGAPFLFPVRLSDCGIPTFEVYGSRTLDSFQRTDLFPESAREERLGVLLEGLRAAIDRALGGQGVAHRDTPEEGPREDSGSAHEHAPYVDRAALSAGTPRSVEIAEGVEMALVWVPPGTFMMGSPPGEAGRYGDETQHEVTLTRGFWMGKYPVTQSEWVAVMGENPSHFKGDRLPVERVSWKDCRRFLARVNEKGTGVFRLPTEAEWEYACRAGSEEAFCFGGGVRKLKAFAWFADNSASQTHPAGEKEPNQWGLCDVHGNVWEWCEDWFGDYGAGAATDPSGATSGNYRVVRGGAWLSLPQHCRSAARSRRSPGNRYNGIGFRVVRTP